MTDEKKKREAELAFKKAILNAKAAKVGGKSYCVSKIVGLQLSNNDEIWEKEGKNDFRATAEVFFVSNTKGGIDCSTGGGTEISGTVEKNDKAYTLVSPIIITKSDMDTSDMKIFVDEQSNV